VELLNIPETIEQLKKNKINEDQRVKEEQQLEQYG